MPPTAQSGERFLPAYLLLVATTFCWGTNVVFGQLAVGHISPQMLVMMRWAGVLLLLAFIAPKHLARDWPVLRQNLWRLFFMGTMGFTAFNSLFYIASHSTTALNMGIIQGSIPIIILVGVFAADRIAAKPLQYLGGIVTLIGVAAVVSAGDISRLAELQFQRGDILMLLACVFYAAYTVKLRNKPNVSALSLFSILAAAAFITALPLLAIEASLGHLQWPTTQGWIVVLLVTLLPSFIAQIFFIRGVEIIGPARAGIFANLVPMFAAFNSIFVLGEAFQLYHFIALILVLSGITLSEWAGRSKHT